MTNKNKIFTDRSFQKLAEQVNNAIIENEGLIGDQKAQVEKVMALEKSFINTIKRHKRAQEVYLLWIDYLVNGLGNLLSGRPYFRESSSVYAKEITPVIKNKNAKKLMDFHANFMLIKFIVEKWDLPLTLEEIKELEAKEEENRKNGKELNEGLFGKRTDVGWERIPTFPPKAKVIYEKFIEARNILIENNLPLAINRAKLFYRKVPKNQLTLLDFIDICTYGLISGIDKYVGEYTTVWRSVCIGRMVGYMIEEYSNSMIRLYPSDKKILYRANSIKHKLKVEDVSKLAVLVTESFKQDAKDGKSIPKLPITADYLKELMNSSNTISADASNNEENENNYDNMESISMYEYNTADNTDISEEVEKVDLMRKVVKASSDLILIEKKVIKLKGVEL